MPAVTSTSSRWSLRLLGGPALPIAALVIGLVVLISFPLPSLALDILVALNLIAGILLLLSVLYIRSIVDFSTFSILLLLTTIFRLATSVSTTRAILSGGSPGDVIKTFGELVVGGSVAVGLVVFFIIAIVQFIVVTKGAERIAEVAARFNLDAMPGRQMSIEADIRAGAITQEQAGQLRGTLRAESQIVGSLDGSMKFVKGDSIAAFIIVFVNLLGGLAVGVGAMGMTFADAGRLFSILTIGDGLVAQIPSILSAIAAGVFVSRAGNESRENIVSQVTSELSANKVVFMIIAGLIGIGGLVPGMPILVFWAISLSIMAGLAFAHYRTSKSATDEIAPQPSKPLELGKYSDPYLCRAAPDALKLLNEKNFSNRLTEATRRQVKQVGIGLPLLLFEADAAVPAQKYRLVFEGVTEAELDLPDNADFDAVADRMLSLLVKRFISNFGPPDTAYYLQQIETSYPHVKDVIQSWQPGLMDSMFQRMLRDGISIAHPRPVVQAIDNALREGVEGDDQIYARLRVAVIDRIIAKLTGDDGRVRLRKPSNELISLAARATTFSEDLSELIGKEDAFNALTTAMTAQSAGMKHSNFLVRDDIRTTCAEAAQNVGIECTFLSETEISNVRPGVILMI